MKKAKYMAAALLLGLSTACSEDVMDRINADNAHPGVNVVSPRFQLTDAIMSSAFATASGDYSFYVCSLTEQELGTGNNQLAHAELRMPSEWAASSTFNNVWNSTYGNLKNLTDMQEKCGQGGIAEGELDILGMAQVLEAYNFAVLTDMHGDIPYSEACKGLDQLQPKLDPQSEIYPALLATLDEAIGNLEAGDGMGNAGSQDILYGGDCQKWIAFAHALKARLTLHMQLHDSKAVANALAEAQKALDMGFDGACLGVFNGISTDNPWSAYHWSRYYTTVSNTVYNLMEPTADPRSACYTFDAFFAFDPGDAEMADMSASYLLTYPAWLELGSQPVTILGMPEVHFIIAECQARLGQDCTAAFQAGVAASVTEICSMGDDTGYLAPQEWDAASFAASLGTPDLNMVMQQKYLSQIVDQQMEAWNDLRRCQALGETYITLTNPCNEQSGQNRLPNLLPYGNSSVVSNPKVAAAYGDGYYIYSTKAWLFNASAE